MAKYVSQLTPPEIKSLEREIGAFVEQPGAGKTRALRIGIERGLYIIVDKRGANSAAWQYRYMHRGKSRSAGLGPWPTVTVKRAAEKADAMRRILKDERRDPLDMRRAEEARERAEELTTRTFRQVAEDYIRSHQSGWGTEHLDQWQKSLAKWAYPLIGSLPVRDIDTDVVKRVLTQPAEGGRFWDTVTKTASRVRGRLEDVLGYAAAEGLRSTDNPATWRGRLEHSLPAPGKVAKVESFAALAWEDLPTFMAKLRVAPGESARALEVAMLTAVRSSELRLARVGEFDLARANWTIPAERMKNGTVHVVPLSARVVDILRTQIPDGTTPDALAFALPERKLRDALAAVAGKGLTVHGTCRATFRSWCAAHGVAHDLAEAALGHAIRDKTVAAYQRDAMLERRRRLAESYARWCDGEGGNVSGLAAA